MISVCMATYNGEDYIIDQVMSILKQLNQDDELIISDDGSSDKTIEKIRNINDKRVKIIFNTNNHGVYWNFENAMKQAKGDYIFLADQDDIWMPNKVKDMLNHLQKYDFVVSDCKVVDSKLNVITESRNDDVNVKSGFLNNMMRCRYLGCCMAFNKKVLQLSLPFPKNSSFVEHDTWIASVAELYTKTYLMHTPTLLYRRHENNVSDGGWGKGYPLWNKVVRRVYRVGCLLGRLYKGVALKFD